jgi:hypothetical protein
MSTSHFPLLVAVSVSLACAGGNRSGFLMTPQLEPIQRCPHAPVGSDARLSLLVLSNRGDTLRSARIRLAGRSALGAVQPTMEPSAPSASGEYDLGPFPVGEYLLTVTDSGWQTARMRLTYCGDSHFRLKAVLVPTGPTRPR